MERWLRTMHNKLKWHEQQIETFGEKNWGVIAVNSTCSFCGLMQNMFASWQACRSIIAEFLFRHWILEKNLSIETILILVFSTAKIRCMLGDRFYD